VQANLVHLHLLLNHVPIIGTFIAIGLFVFALAVKSDELKHVTCALFALIGVLAIPTYLTGHLAERVMQNEPGVSQAVIATHQGAAFVALATLLVTAAFAWAGVWQYRRRARLQPWVVPGVLVFALITAGLMAVTGNTGGFIRHPEILAGEEATSVIGSVGVRITSTLQYIVTGSSRYIWPILETLHFVGLILLIGTLGILNLRLLGWFKDMPTAPLTRFLPWAILGLAINTVTGMLFFIGMPFFYVYNLDFQFKIVALVIAAASLLFYSTTAFADVERLQPGEDAPGTVKLVAASSLILWIAVVVLGRYMPMFEDTLGF
jgi:uncharacterized membrane protein